MVKWIVTIFCFSYIAPDSPFDIVSQEHPEANDVGETNVISSTVNYNLTREHVNDIVSGICPQKELSSNNNTKDNNEHCPSENDQSKLKPELSIPIYFDSAALYVANLLKMGYYDEFLQSPFYAKYQVSF